jgi:hypothetical protein
MTVGITELPPEGMQLGGVALAGDAERGTKTTEGLSLLFTTAGITVQGPQPQIERLLVWSGLDSANCREKVALPDGRNAAVMELTSGGQAIRFLLPLDTVTPGQAAYLDQALPAWLARYKGGTASATPPSPPPAPSATGANTHEQVAPPPAAGPGATPPATNGSTRGPAAAAATQPPVGATAPPGSGSFDAPPPPPNPERQVAPADAPGAPGVAPFLTGTLPATPAPAATTTPPTPLPAASAPTSSDPTAPLPPPPPPAASAPTTEPIAPLPPPPPPGATAAAGTAAWTGAPPPPPTGTGGPPAEQAGGAVAAGKKSRGWRKSKDGPPRSAPTEASGAVAPAWPPADPPSEPPVNPVPLTKVTLPPPPAEGPGAPGPSGPVVWQPPIDPITGEALWDQVQAPSGSPSKGTSDSPPKRAKGWRRGAKTAAVGAAGAAGAAGAVGVATPTGPELSTGPAEGSPPDTPDGGVAPAATGDTQTPRRNRPLITVLVIVLVVVLGGIAYFAVKRNNNSTTSTTAAVTNPSVAVAGATLAASVNLRIGDLPTGWERAPAIGQTPSPPVAPVPAQAQANQALAGCLGVSYQTVAGLFDNATLPGQTGAARSPTFQSGSNPNVLMYSLATVLGSTAQLQALGVPFANANFTTCFGQYQSSLAAAAAPGATASVQSVALTAPAGVTAYGYLTTLTIPNQGSIVVGQAFLLGGRIETLLEPSTNGPSVPSSNFTPAFDAVAARMAATVDR